MALPRPGTCPQGSRSPSTDTEGHLGVLLTPRALVLGLQGAGTLVNVRAGVESEHLGLGTGLRTTWSHRMATITAMSGGSDS